MIKHFDFPFCLHTKSPTKTYVGKYFSKEVLIGTFDKTMEYEKEKWEYVEKNVCACTLKNYVSQLGKL